MRVLIADDDEITLDLLEHALVQAGYTVERATNGREALEHLRQGECRLVISDWDMPELTGVELCRAIRVEDLGGYIYVVLLTSRHSARDTVEGLSAGADDFVPKPFHPDELISRVRSGERILSLETREVALFALAKLAESRDSDTGAHLERVQCYSRVLAQELAQLEKHRAAIDAEFIRLIYLTSPLHDIGKVGIPDGVLLKPGRLSDREFEIMKSHATIGARTLEAALEKFPEAKFLVMARDIAAAHHERYDGHGYPLGLAGDRIPLAARIVTVADVYDALTSRRVYKDAMQHEVARSIIIEESGSHFDPDVVDAFLAREAEFVAIRERFQPHHLAATT
ncbi:MAG: response regulator [Pirellulales bacterium]|nr:response regulator [Pirellulales bacterium]